MSVRSASQSADIADRADEVYERVVRPTLGPADMGRFVVLDLESEDFVVDPDETLAFLQLRERHPKGTFFVLRAGERTAYRIGSGSARGLSR